MHCFAGDIECLRMDDYTVTVEGLRAGFGSENARVTHCLTLSPDELVVDLHACPYLEHLDESAPESL
ncbi:hypothetical protein LXA43DRAFT_1165080 [Ganoderma leucocontextum]|nr:hypothetical protein LXA43DRAFT_1165080 [Ganoderma leucocontextum]